MRICIGLLCAEVAHRVVRRLDLPEPVAPIVEYAICSLMQWAIELLYISLPRA